ncbi:MAG: tryptophan-rich sensory protein [Ardenticatenaceae bacterium]|nr:tryptophan-rich sensory protein [Ardenticatenaceae bacterium]
MINQPVPQNKVTTAAGFAAGMLAIGMGVSFLAMTFLPIDVFTPQNVPEFASFGWIFWAVWIVIYPSLGVATYLIWKRRHVEDVTLPLLLFGVSLIQGFTFWLSDTVRMTTVIDGTGLLFSYTLAFVYYRHSKSAALWLLPLLIWMPITLILKIWLWVTQGG